jgi:hypothetical protein
MVKPSDNSRVSGISTLLAALAILLIAAGGAGACPFCTALGPSLAQRREQSAVVALAEVESQSSDKRARLRIHRVLKGAERLDGKLLDIPLEMTVRAGSLLLVFASDTADKSPSELTWQAVSVNETSYAYFAKSPSLKEPTVQRLVHFVPCLEHRDPLIAEDAYLEFGHAPFDEVARMADQLPMDRVRVWLGDANVPATRKGFYGLALGLATQPDVRRANAELLRQMIVEPADDFRAGFDGILGGYLLLAGNGGLELIESRYLSNARAADGDVRHAQTALRFYWEYGREIPRERIARACRRLIARPEFAESAIVDLARWKDWTAVDQIAALYHQQAYVQPAIRRAVVGYLLACPEARASGALDKLRKSDPQGVAAAEQVLSQMQGLSSSPQ